MNAAFTVIRALGLLLFTQGVMATGENPVHIELLPRSPEQMSAFYEARGFPEAMIRLLAKQCFVTVRIHNTGKEVIWLDLANWRFSSEEKEIERYHRNHWKALWKEMNIPLASQSTFRWTLLPETLDYQPDEKEGGNIILPRLQTPITLVAEFETGTDRRGPLLRWRYENLRCAENQP